MQVTVDLIDWEWVQTAPNAPFFLEVMLEEDEADLKFGTSCYQFAGGWSDSALLYLAVCDAFPLVLEKISIPEQREKVEQGLLPVLSLDRKADVLGLQAFPEECYIASMAPETIAAMATACEGLNLNQLAIAFDEAIPQASFQREDRLNRLQDYLRQWIIALQTARLERKGMLVHMG